MEVISMLCSSCQVFTSDEWRNKDKWPHRDLDCGLGNEPPDTVGKADEVNVEEEGKGKDNPQISGSHLCVSTECW